ncbi:uncharacterized protein LOC116965386 isoform X4 [Tyto alba]|uniref:uncharacterized protein LOC116965386 isoform X4 n=1 Tax=Tyto alba TaxID=56313 RepID=UPI001C6779C4|nr:uncharacterized protein LOC116965386 isoform X4 [Tyto alba]
MGVQRKTTGALPQTAFKSARSTHRQPGGPRSCPFEAPWHPPGGTCTSRNGPWSHDGVERSCGEICHLIPGLPKFLLSNIVMLELYCCKRDYLKVSNIRQIYRLEERG